MACLLPRGSTVLVSSLCCMTLQKNKAVAAGPGGANTDDLQARLDNLRRGDDD